MKTVTAQAGATKVVLKVIRLKPE